jgi:hypothetical protein
VNPHTCRGGGAPDEAPDLQCTCNTGRSTGRRPVLSRSSQKQAVPARTKHRTTAAGSDHRTSPPLRGASVVRCSLESQALASSLSPTRLLLRGLP